MIQKPPIERSWVRCPYCGMKVFLFDNTAICRGVFAKCTRGCKKVFEVIVQNGRQIVNK